MLTSAAALVGGDGGLPSCACGSDSTVTISAVGYQFCLLVRQRRRKAFPTISIALHTAGLTGVRSAAGRHPFAKFTETHALHVSQGRP